MIIVHHLNNSRSQRILWLLEELGLEYEVRRYQRDPETMLAPPELAQIHPLGKSPVVEDDGRVVAESGAIIEYLVAHHGDGSLRPTGDSETARRTTYFLHYAEGSLMPPLLLKLVFDRLSGPSAPLLFRPLGKMIGGAVSSQFIKPNLDRHMAFLEGEMSQRDWFAGEYFSVADIQMSFPLEAARSRGVVGEDQPKLMDWLQRISDRPAYQAAIERGGEYELGG